MSDDNEHEGNAVERQALDAHEEKIAKLLERCGAIYDEEGHSECWRNELAADLNWILSRAEYVLQTGGDESDINFAEAALRVVQRVADIERVRFRPNASIPREELQALANRLEKEADGYNAQIEEARQKNLPHDCTLGNRTALRWAAARVRDVLERFPKPPVTGAAREGNDNNTKGNDDAKKAKA